jgi:hypothetical protein
MAALGLEHYRCYCNKLPPWDVRLVCLIGGMRLVQLERTVTEQKMLGPHLRVGMGRSRWVVLASGGIPLALGVMNLY